MVAIGRGFFLRHKSSGALIPPPAPLLWSIATSDASLTEGDTADWTITRNLNGNAAAITSVTIREMTAAELGVAASAVAGTADLQDTLLNDCIVSALADGHCTALFQAGDVRLTFDATWDGTFLLNRLTKVNPALGAKKTGVVIISADGSITTASIPITISDAVVPKPPVNTSLPTITGDGIVGNNQILGDGAWTGDAPILFPVRKLYRRDPSGAGSSGVAGKSFLGSQEIPGDATSFTFGTISLQTGRIVVEYGARSATTVPVPTITVAGGTPTPIVSNTNPDAFGASRAGIVIIDLASLPNNNIIVDFGATTIARCGVKVHKITDTASLAAFHTASAIPDGTGVGQAATINTANDGVLIATSYMTSVNGNNRLSSASMLTTAQTGMSISAGNAGAAGISWLTATKDSDTILEAGSNGDGVMVVASWAPAPGSPSVVDTEITGVNFAVPYVPVTADLTAGFIFEHIEANNGVGGNVAAESVLMTISAASPGTLPVVTPSLRVYDFTNMVGLNVQPDRTDYGYSYNQIYPDPAGATQAYQRVVDMLGYLGTLHTRCVAPITSSTFYPDAWNYYASHGLKLCMHHGAPTNYAGVKSSLTETIKLETAYPNSVAFVEGCNEINNFYGWPAYTDRNGVFRAGGAFQVAAQYRQDDLFYAVHTDPVGALLNSRGALVVRFTTGTGYYAVGNCDFHNGHNYPGLTTPQTWAVSGVPDSSPLPTRIRNGIVDHVSESVIPQFITECGCHTDTLGGANFDEVTGGLLVFYYWLIGAERGIKRMYFYEGYDGSQTGATESHFGLFHRALNNTDGTPKPAAVNIHNTNLIIADAGGTKASFTLTNTNYKINGLPSTAKTLTLQASNGNIFVMIWNEAPFYRLVSPIGPIAVAASPLSAQVVAGKTATWYSPCDSTAAIANPSLVTKPLILKIA